MMRGRPAVYATFSSYDEVAHHSGLERADTLEALRKLDQQFGRIDRARRYAPRPYEIVVLSDHGQTQGATFKQRNGYGLDELVERSLVARATSRDMAGGDEQAAMVGHALGEATGRRRRRRSAKNDVSDRDVVVLGSGNLGLVYLMEERRRLTLEEIDERHPELVPGAARAPARRLGARALRRARRRSCSARDGAHYLAEDRVEGEDPLAALLADRRAAPAAHRRLRARRRPHGRQLLRPGSRRGLRVRGADLLPRRARGLPDPAVHPPPAHRCSVPDGPILGAAAVHAILARLAERARRARARSRSRRRRDASPARSAGARAAVRPVRRARRASSSDVSSPCGRSSPCSRVRPSSPPP